MNGPDGIAVTHLEREQIPGRLHPSISKAVSYWSQGFPGTPSSDTYGQET